VAPVVLAEPFGDDRGCSARVLRDGPCRRTSQDQHLRVSRASGDFESDCLVAVASGTLGGRIIARPGSATEHAVVNGFERFGERVRYAGGNRIRPGLELLGQISTRVEKRDTSVRHPRSGSRTCSDGPCPRAGHKRDG